MTEILREDSANNYATDVVHYNGTGNHIPNVILVFQMRRSEIVNTINTRRFEHLLLPEPVFITGCLHIYWLPSGG